MKHFMNIDLGALDVVTAPVDPAIVAEFAPLANGTFDDPDYATIRPPWNSDIRWISPNSQASFDLFQSAFDRLGIAEPVRQYLDLDRAPRMYAGFILLRTECTEADFHYDWQDTGNQAFTFIAPISANAAGFGLLYRKVNGAIGEYDYRLGEGIFLGDDFCHSTKPGRSAEPIALLCFTFGTDKMDNWDKILRTVGYQCRLIRRPDGQFAVNRRSFFGRRRKWITRPPLR